MAVKPIWVYSTRFRINLSLNPKGKKRSYSVVTKYFDFGKIFSVNEQLDPNSIRIIEYNPKDGKPKVHSPGLRVPVCYETPFNFEPDYEGLTIPVKIRAGTLTWLMPTEENTHYSIYFGTLESGPRTEYLNMTSMGNNDLILHEFAPLTVGSISRPAVVDWNGYGVFDLVVGSYRGEITYFENVGTNDLPEIVRRGYLKDSKGKIIRHFGAFPCVVDWDDDGVNDLLVGCSEGKIYYYHNLGSNAQPIFESKGFLKDKKGVPISISRTLTFFPPYAKEPVHLPPG